MNFRRIEAAVAAAVAGAARYSVAALPALLLAAAACNDAPQTFEPSRSDLQPGAPNAAAGSLAPTVKITKPANGATFAQGVKVTFAGTATNGSGGSLHGTSLVWSSSINTQTITGDSISTSALPLGTHTVTLTAKNAQGVTGKATVTVTIANASANKAPTATISAPANNASYAQGAKVTFTGAGADAEDGALSGASLVWTSNVGGQIGTGASVSTTTLAAGTHTITLTAKDSKGATGTATRTITITAAAGGGTTPPPANQSWTFCTNAGAPCQFTGLRDVRLGGPNGPWTTKTVYHIVPCASYGFNNQDPAPGQQLHCDYGALKTTTMQNPQPGMAGMPATVTVPLGWSGASGAQSRQVGGQGVYSDFGAFRMQCSLAKFAFDDPIVYPGQKGTSHLHMFFGNTAVDGTSTSQSIAATGNSTCAGGTLNRTGYWMPAVFDKTTGAVVAPGDVTVYYKSGFNVDYRLIQPMPTGLKIIAGDKNNTGSQEHVWWECTDKNVGYSPTIPSCGQSVRMLVIFPQCWDGKNLDAPDHKSHMAYPVYANTHYGSKCPATHPVTLPEITEIFDFPVPGGANPAANWRLSSDMYATSLPGGRSAHADWMMGWDAPTMKTLVTQCLNKGMDCGVNFIGNGTEIYQYY